MRLRHILPILHIIAILLPQGAGAECGGDTLRHAGGGGPAAVERARAAVDSLLDRIGWQKSTRADTAYITRTPGRLRLKLTLSGSGSDIDTRWSSGGESFRSRLKAQNKYTTSITASYRGLSLSVAFNPAKLSGRNKDYELNLNAYGNRFGADLILQSTKTYEGSVSTPAGGEAAVAAGGVSQDMITASAYYVFSGRRFSFPAAFTQSWIQRRSHGSFMLGVSFIGGRIKTEAPDVIGSSVSRLTVVSAGVGAGYAHNWVVKRRWLLHISTLPQFIVFSRNRLTAGGSETKMPYRFPNMNVMGRIAVVRHFGRYFAGINAVVNTSDIGDRGRLSVSNLKWRARVFVGVSI